MFFRFSESSSPPAPLFWPFPAFWCLLFVCPQRWCWSSLFVCAVTHLQLRQRETPLDSSAHSSERRVVCRWSVSVESQPAARRTSQHPGRDEGGRCMLLQYAFYLFIQFVISFLTQLWGWLRVWHWDWNNTGRKRKRECDSHCEYNFQLLRKELFSARTLVCMHICKRKCGKMFSQNVQLDILIFFSTWKDAN